MRLRTPLCDRLGIEFPIIQAPIGGATCPELAAAVSNAGGLGMLAMSWRDPDTIRAMIRETKALTKRPFGVNLVLEWPQAERLAVCLEEGVRILSFFWGDPCPYLPMVADAGALVMQTVGSAAEARAAAELGADVIVAQGWEAGGHVWGQTSTMALVPRAVDAAGGTPVIAAGGIADGRGIAAALALGAQGAWIGTRFLASQEATAHPRYKNLLLEAGEDITVHTTLFDGGWPNAPHRVLRNRTYEAWMAAGSPQPGDRPGEGTSIGQYPDGSPVLLYDDAMPRLGYEGDLEAMALYAGQGVGLVENVMPAAAIINLLVRQTLEAIKKIDPGK